MSSEVLPEQFVEDGGAVLLNFSVDHEASREIGMWSTRRLTTIRVSRRH
jgi:hypothetical protein